MHGLPHLVGCQRLDAQGMYSTPHQVAQCSEDQTMPSQGRFARKGGRDDTQAQVGTSVLGAGMTGVPGGIVDQGQLIGRERMQMLAKKFVERRFGVG